MMKTFIILLSFSMMSLQSMASEQCSLEAEEQLGLRVPYLGITKPGVFLGVTENQNLIYYVDSNYQGGDARYEVITTPQCDYVSHRLLWAE